MKLPKMFRLTLRELILMAIIVCMVAGWLGDRYRMDSRLEELSAVPQQYETLKGMLKRYDGESAKISWDGDVLNIDGRYMKSGNRFPSALHLITDDE